MSKSGVLAFLRASSLKHVQRSGWVQHGVPAPERVAGHSHRLALMAMVLERTEGGVRAGGGEAVDMGRVMRMAVVHDIAEADVGDITPADGVPKAEKARLEAAAVARFGAMLAGTAEAGAADATAALFHEYEDDATPEAHVCHELDKFDMILQAFEYEQQFAGHADVKLDLDQFYSVARRQDPPFFRHEPIVSWVAALMAEREAWLAARQTA